VARARKIINAIARFVRFGLPLPFVALMMLQHAEFLIAVALPPKPEAIVVHHASASRTRKEHRRKFMRRKERKKGRGRP
jgi:hypothetical protein